MSDRPLGITLLCIAFGLFGFSFVVFGLDLMGEVSESSSGYSLSVEIFLLVMPLFVVVLGVLAVYAGYKLWHGTERGFYAGLGVLVLWIIQEIIMLVWGLVGPEVVQEFSGVGSNLARILVAVALIAYLISKAGEFIYDDSAPSQSTQYSV